MSSKLGKITHTDRTRFDSSIFQEPKQTDMMNEFQNMFEH